MVNRHSLVKVQTACIPSCNHVLIPSLFKKLVTTCASFHLCLLADASDVTDSDNCLVCSPLDWSVLISCVSLCVCAHVCVAKTTQQNTDRHPDAACWILPSAGVRCGPVTRAYRLSPDASRPPLALWRVNKGPLGGLAATSLWLQLFPASPPPPFLLFSTETLEAIFRLFFFCNFFFWGWGYKPHSSVSHLHSGQHASWLFLIERMGFLNRSLFSFDGVKQALKCCSCCRHTSVASTKHTVNYGHVYGR